MNRDRRKAQEMADKYNNTETWDAAVRELGLEANGKRVRRPPTEVCGHSNTHHMTSRHENHTYFVIFIFSYFAGILMFDYFTWKRKNIQ
jgi:hypothetical protein